MASLVFSYAHADEELRNELEKHLSPLKRMGEYRPGTIVVSSLAKNSQGRSTSILRKQTSSCC